jgi:hypothetical protein
VTTELASEFRSEPRRRSARARLVTLVGPVTVAAGVVWAVWQPYRLTFLHPDGQGFWRLAIEPPLLVVLVAVIFHFLIAPGLLEDLEWEEER